MTRKQKYLITAACGLLLAAGLTGVLFLCQREPELPRELFGNCRWAF